MIPGSFRGFFFLPANASCIIHPSGEDENTEKHQHQKLLGMTGDQLAINTQNCGEHSKTRYMNRITGT